MIEIKHYEMWAVYAADDESNGPPLAMCRSEKEAERFRSQEGVPDDDKINVDMCVMHCFVEIVLWNSYENPGEGRLYRASRLLGHGDLEERERLIESERAK